MLQLIAYVFFNLLGFSIFYAIWLKLEKPEPYDYTTLPGLKCEELGLTKRDIVLPVGIPINKLSDSKGNLSEIQSAGDVNRFFLWLHDVYGIVAAFYWGPRYTVSVASLKLIQELKAHEGSLKPINPFLYASVLFGDPRVWGKSTALIATNQPKFFMTYSPDECIGFPDKRIDGPMAIVFDCEVEIDAHPVPANIPILICAPLINEWSQERVHEEFKWIFDKCLLVA